MIITIITVLVTFVCLQIFTTKKGFSTPIISLYTALCVGTLRLGIIFMENINSLSNIPISTWVIAILIVYPVIYLVVLAILYFDKLFVRKILKKDN